MDKSESELRSFDWNGFISEWEREWSGLSLEQEFDKLRKLGKHSRAQASRTRHLEMHLDQGDIICKCEGGI